MFRFYANKEINMSGIFGIIILILDVLAILDVLKSSYPTGKKVLWVLLILILPVLGLALYYLVGKKS